MDNIQLFLNYQGMNYIQTFLNYQGIHMDYPRNVHIETNAKCNAKCKFCPHSVLERKNKVMPEELFYKIIKDLKEIPGNIPFAISPFKVNEPLLDNTIFEKIYYINQELPNATICLTSNFNIATPDQIEKMSKIKKLAYIWISLNSLQEDDYRDIMGLDLKKTVNNIKLLLEYNENIKFVDRIVLARVGDDTIKDKEFIEDAGKMFNDKIEPKVTCRGEWLGYLSLNGLKCEELPCAKWFEVSITCTGEVALCCMDGKCEHPIGDVRNNSVLEIYNGSLYKELRKNAYERKYITPCKECSFL